MNVKQVAGKIGITHIVQPHNSYLSGWGHPLLFTLSLNTISVFSFFQNNLSIYI